MIFALGFLFAGLAALAFAPAFWRRANRLTRRRLEMQVPLSVQEILAERDQLRAEFAVEQRRVELRAAQVNLAHAADRGELGRRAVEIAALKEKLAQRTRENRESEQMLAQLEADLSQVSAELGAVTKALYDTDSLYQRKQGEFVELTQAHEAMMMLAEERLANHAAAEARCVALELRFGDLSRKLLEAEKQFTEQIAQASKLSDALVLSNRNLEDSESNCSALQKKFEAEAARAAQIAQEVEALRAQRDEDQRRLRSLTAEIGTVVRLARPSAEPSPDGAASETSAETDTPALRVVSPAAPADAEPAEQREVRDQVGT
jgi:chromosome segregation ATPase